MTNPASPFDARARRLDFYPYFHTIETRSTDASDWRGHIPNGQIARFGDDARLGLHQAIMGEGEPRIFQLVESRFRFFHELRFPGPIVIGVAVTGIGTTSIRQIAGYFSEGRCHVLADFALVKVVDGAKVPLSADERLRAAPFVIALPA